MEEQNNQTNNQIDDIARDEEYFKVRKDLYFSQIKFGIVVVLIFFFIVLTLLFTIPNLEQIVFTVLFVVTAVISAILWESIYKNKVLDKYDPKYKRVKFWQ